MRIKKQTVEETKLTSFIAKNVIAMGSWAVIIIDGIGHTIHDIAFGELAQRVRQFIRDFKLQEVLSA